MAVKKEKKDYLQDLIPKQQPIPYRIGEEAEIKTDSGVTKVSKKGDTVSELKMIDVPTDVPAPVAPAEEPNLDDLIKKKQLELLTREVDNTGRAPAENNNNWIADALTAASPALVSWAIGGTHNAHVREFDKGNKYLQQRYNTDKVKEIDVDGKPQFIRQQDSIGMQPYKTPPRPVFEKGSGTGKDGKPEKGSFGGVPLTNIKTGQKLVGIRNNHTGTYEVVDYDKDGKEIRTKLNGSDWTPTLKQDVRSAKTAQGGINMYTINPNTGKTNKVISEKGEGDYFGGITSKEVGSQVKQAETANKVINQIADIESKADMALKILNDPSSGPSELAAANQLILKTLEPQKLSDKDFVNLSGDRYRDYATLLESYTTRRFDGDESIKIRQELIKTATELKQLNRTNLDHINKIYFPKKGTVASKRIEQNVGGRFKLKEEPKKPVEQFRILSPAEMDSLSPASKKEYLNAFRKHKGL